MSNRTLWTVIGIVVLVFIGLLVFGVVSIPTHVIPETTETSASAMASLAAAL